MINKNDFDYARMKGIDDTLAKKRWDFFEDAVAQKKTINWIDEHKKTDGGVNYILRNLYPYFENDALKLVIGYGIDITERKLIEIKLSEALESIKNTNNELEQFAYVASHDLQEPLRMVTSFLSQLEKKYGESLDEKAREYILKGSLFDTHKTADQAEVSVEDSHLEYAADLTFCFSNKMFSKVNLKPYGRIESKEKDRDVRNQPVDTLKKVFPHSKIPK
jgi:signal transduction histidine kinase